MDDIILTQLRRIPTPGGDVFHGMKSNDPGFAGFGEAYFSSVESRAVKGWKRHNRMTLNFVVPVGDIQISIFDETTETRRDFVLGPDRVDSYNRLTIPPGYWVAFGGRTKSVSLLLNLASLPHDPTEADNVPLTTFDWKWLELR